MINNLLTISFIEEQPESLTKINCARKLRN
jgi:hypothetical protein